MRSCTTGTPAGCAEPDASIARRGDRASRRGRRGGAPAGRGGARAARTPPDRLGPRRREADVREDRLVHSVRRPRAPSAPSPATSARASLATPRWCSGCRARARCSRHRSRCSAMSSVPPRWTRSHPSTSSSSTSVTTCPTTARSTTSSRAHRGVAILHDRVMHHLFAHYWLDRAERRRARLPPPGRDLVRSPRRAACPRRAAWRGSSPLGGRRGARADAALRGGDRERRGRDRALARSRGGGARAAGWARSRSSISRRAMTSWSGRPDRRLPFLGGRTAACVRSIVGNVNPNRHADSPDRHAARRRGARPADPRRHRGS